jgi:hypothetical protein
MSGAVHLGLKQLTVAKESVESFGKPDTFYYITLHDHELRIHLFLAFG